MQVDRAPKPKWYSLARRLSWWASHLRAVLRAPRRSFEVEHLAVVNDPIHDGRRERHVLDDQRPVGQALVGREQNRALGIAAGDDLVERRAEARLGGQVAQL